MLIIVLRSGYSLLLVTASAIVFAAIMLPLAINALSGIEAFVAWCNKYKVFNFGSYVRCRTERQMAHAHTGWRLNY